MTRLTGRRCRRGSFVPAVVAALTIATWASPTLAAGTADPIGTPHREGDVRLTDPYDQTKPVTHGGAKTEFSLKVPGTCPGDSAHDQWRIQSFIIPADQDPIQIEYGAIGPHPYGNGRYAMFGTDTTPYVHELLQRNPVAGQPGLIPQMPPFSFDVIAGERIPSGTYRVGASCSYFGKTAYYWDTQVIITDTLTDDGSGTFDWRLASEPESVNTPKDDTNMAMTLGLGGAGVAAVGSVSFVFWRRGRNTPLREKERP
jgi:hypothetical protein